MVFASLTFLYLFLPVGLALYFLARGVPARNAVLVLLSFAFYAWGEPVWVVLLLLSAGVDYVNGLVIERTRDCTWKPRAVVAFSLLFNLGLLVVFKYSTFIAQSINAVLGTELSAPVVSLPVGISFYTFQTISYVVDVYRGQVRAQRSFATFLVFVTSFPQLVAGPIVRYSEIESALTKRSVSIHDVSEGLCRFAVGLFKKVCVANVAAELVAAHLGGDLSTLSVAEAWFGLFAFTLQIYFDFSGYSDMAIGLGRIFGFRFPENFDHPYIARSATEFWRRWHMSLTRFFRDYVYIPLGGNRTNAVRNLFVVWMLTGLWHGASWNFVLWGLYFGVLIHLERRWLGALLERAPRLLSHVYLLVAVVLGWGLFYFEDFAALGEFARVAFHWTPAPWARPELAATLRSHALWLVLAIALCTPLPAMLRRAAEDALGRSGSRYGFVRGADAALNFVFLLAASSMLVGHTYNPFLYFRF